MGSVHEMMCTTANAVYGAEIQSSRSDWICEVFFYFGSHIQFFVASLSSSYYSLWRLSDNGFSYLLGSQESKFVSVHVSAFEVFSL